MNAAREAPLTEEDARRFAEDGVVCLRGVFDGWVERLARATARSLKAGGMEMGADGQARFHSNFDMWLGDEDFHAFVFQSPAASVAQALMGSRSVRFYFDHLFVKEAGAQTPTPWHHDQPYWPVRGDQIASIWVTLDPVSLDTSGLEYVKGSHRWGRRYEPARFGERSDHPMLARDEANEPIPDFDSNRSSYEFLSWDMQPGDCLVHHSLAIHGARGNRSTTTPRRALSTRWLGDDVVYWPSDDPNTYGPLAIPELKRGERLPPGRYPEVARATEGSAASSDG